MLVREQVAALLWQVGAPFLGTEMAMYVRMYIYIYTCSKARLRPAHGSRPAPETRGPRDFGGGGARYMLCICVLMCMLLVCLQCGSLSICLRTTCAEFSLRCRRRRSRLLDRVCRTKPCMGAASMQDEALHGSGLNARRNLAREQRQCRTKPCTGGVSCPSAHDLSEVLDAQYNMS